MLKKEYIKQLLNEKEYDKIYEYLYFEYSYMLYNFIKIREEDYKKKTLKEQIRYIMFKYPKYTALMEILIDMFSNEDDTLLDSLNNMIDNYTVVKNTLI